ncbi:MAG: hypothetical protein EOP10_25760 [Proteobacteria bacterium]|nr:MAG: hypothetical protein EOP10_25760 [Pseudomonadota bacterium]
MAKKPWIILGFLAAAAVGAETGRRMLTSHQTSPESDVVSIQVKSVQTPMPPTLPPEIFTKEAQIRELFGVKKFDEALRLIDSEVQTNQSKASYQGYIDWLKRQRFVVRTAQAFAFLEKQNCSAAMTILEEIPEADRPTVALKGMGYCKFLTREWSDADALLTRYLQVQSQDHESIQMLARTKEAKGEFDEAIALTDSLQNIEDKESAELQMEPLRKSLLAKQTESLNQLVRAGSFFTLYYQPNVSPDYLDRVVETLGKTAAKLKSAYGIDYPEKSIDIFFHDTVLFGEITHGPEWSAGLYDGQIRLPIEDGENFTETVARAIRHELTHAFLSEMVARRNLPTWFQEGFAQLAECEQLCTQYDYAATTQKFMPAEKFEQSFLNLPMREAQVAYKQSLYMVLLLVHHQPDANIRQMFMLMPGLESLSSQELIALTSWSFTLLHQTAKNTWEGQISLKSIRPQN